MEGAAVSKMIKNVQIPPAIISLARSLAPFTDLRCMASTATKNETTEVARNNPEKIVKTWFIMYYFISTPKIPRKLNNIQQTCKNTFVEYHFEILSGKSPRQEPRLTNSRSGEIN